MYSQCGSGKRVSDGLLADEDHGFEGVVYGDFSCSLIAWASVVFKSCWARE